MTVEEIKQTVSMKDVLGRYGIKINKNGMCCCPIHHEKHPSMKVFPDGYKCFACNSSGDVITFVQQMEGCSFKDAFLLLGGTYENHENETRRRLLKQKYKRDKIKQQQKNNFEQEFRQMIDYAIFKCEVIITYHEPFSDGWCEAQNALPWLEYVWDMKYLKDEEINKADVIRVWKITQ